MPVTPTYPGVYVEEIPSGVRTITGVATSIAAFIGRAPKGPVNEPVLINNYGEYEQIFGGLWTESNLGFAVRDFYNNGGSQAVIVRLYNDPGGDVITKTQLFVPISNATVTGGTAAVNGTATVSGGTATLTRSIVTGSNAAIGSNDTVKITGGRAEVTGSGTVTARVNIGTVQTGTITATITGGTGTVTGGTADVTNSTITVSSGTISGGTITTEDGKVTGGTATVTGGTTTVTGGTATVTGGTATVSSSEVADDQPLEKIISCGKVTGGDVEVIGGVVTGAHLTVTVSMVTGSTATVDNSAEATVIGNVSAVEGEATSTVSTGGIVTVTLTGGTVTGGTVEIDGTQTATVTGGTATISGDTITVTGDDVETLQMYMKLEGANEGAWGNELEADVNHDFPTDDDTQAQVAEENLFNLYVKDNDTGVEEIFQNVSENSYHKRYVKNVLEKDSQLVRVSGDVPSKEELPDEGDEWDYLNSLAIPAVDGDPLEATDFTDGESEKKGIYALEKADLFNLLCIPPYKDDGNVDVGVIDAAIIYCEKRRAMMIIDSPSDWTNKEDAKTGIDGDVGSTSTNGAIFFPRLVMPNPLKDNQIETFAACGAVAGIFARTDATRGVWKAPAGLEAVLRGGVLALSVPLTDPENGELNPLGINCLRNKPPAGKIVWGSRTRVGDDRLASEWKYIPVRRLALYMQESLYRGTKWAVFEPNDEPLWAQLRLSIGSFMNNLFRQGAFQGSSASDAYFVKCDKETTTQYDIDRGIVNIVIGFAPLKPAEFVILKFQQIAGQS